MNIIQLFKALALCCAVFINVLNAVPNGFDGASSQYLAIDTDRIEIACAEWHAHFKCQKNKRYMTVGGAVMGSLAVVGAYLWATQQQPTSSDAPGRPVPDAAAIQTRLFNVLLEQMERNKSLQGRFALVVEDGVTKSVMLVIAGLCATILSGAGAWIWDSVKQGLGFADDLVLKTLIRDYFVDANRYMMTMTSFLKTELPTQSDSLRTRLIQQKMYGLLINQRAFVATIERCLGFVIASLQCQDLADEERFAMTHSLERLIELFNDSFMHQYQGAQAHLQGEKALDASWPFLVQGVCEEGMRLMTSIGMLKFGKEFNAQPVAAV